MPNKDDDVKPKKPMTAYFLFRDQNKEKITKLHGSLKSSFVKTEYDKLTENELKKYKDQYQKSKDIYDADMEKWNKKHGKKEKIKKDESVKKKKKKASQDKKKKEDKDKDKIKKKKKEKAKQKEEEDDDDDDEEEDDE